MSRMVFPLRLNATLAIGMGVRALGARRNDPLIFKLTPDGNCHAVAASIGSPIVWIGGAEPLEQPEVPSVANALAAAGRYVFLQTNGVLLRRRIHELQPLPRLFLTVRLDFSAGFVSTNPETRGSQAAHDARAGHAGAFGLALEGVRAARLSGFLICAQMILHAERDTAELVQLHEQLGKLDLDGMLISAAAPAADVQRAAEVARLDLLESGWARLSRLLDSMVLPAPTTATLFEAPLSLPTPLVKAPSPGEESVPMP